MSSKIKLEIGLDLAKSHVVLIFNMLLGFIPVVNCQVCKFT
jgi:primosomal protein N'